MNDEHVVTIIYKSGTKVVFPCTSFEAVGGRGATTLKWEKGPDQVLRPLWLNVDEVESVWAGRP